MPVKKKVKKIKIKAIRGVRAGKQTQKKPNVKQTVNVFTTSTEPYRTDFRDQYRYGLGYVEREQTPFQPVFNYIQPPVPVTQSQLIPQEKKVEIVEPKKKTGRPVGSKNKPVAVATVAEPLSRQSSYSGFESDYMPSGAEAFRSREQAMTKKLEDEMRNVTGGGFMSSEASPIIPEQKKRGGRQKGSKNKPKMPTEAVAQSTEEPQFSTTLKQPDIMSFFSKIKE
jgi:hypothetical protein